MIVTIFEHSKVKIAEKRDLENAVFSKNDLADLLSIKLDKKSVFKFHNSQTLKTDSIVGSITLKDGVIIEILPKIAKEKNIESYRKEFVKLIRFTDKRNSFVSSSTSSKVSIKELPLISYVVELFSENLLAEIRKGSDKGYTKVIESNNTIRGKIDIQKTLNRHPFDRSRVVVEYRKRTENTNLMKVFKSISILLLEDRTFSYRTKQNFFEVRNLLENVENIQLRESDFERVQFSRLNSRFETLFNQARTIFYNYMPYTAKIDSTPFWSILFDMNYLFEKFVETLFKKSGIPFVSQKSHSIYDKIKVVPDIILDDFIVDTKYKIYKDRPNREDIYQLITYVSTLKKRKGYFIAPSFKDRENLVFEPKIGGTEIEVIFVNIGSGIDEVVKHWRFSISDELRFSKIHKPEQELTKNEIYKNAIQERDIKTLQELAKNETEETKIKLSNEEKNYLKKVQKQFGKEKTLLAISDSDNLNLMQFLIEEKNFNVNYRDKDGLTPLMVASSKHLNNVVFLLKHKAKIDSQDKYGRTALFHAVLCDNFEIVKVLLENGAEPNLRIEKGITYLMMASENSNFEIAKALLENGAEPNLTNDLGNTALIEAAYFDCIDIVDLLLDYGANPNLKNQDNETALDIATIEENYNVVISIEKAINLEQEKNLFDFTVKKEQSLFDISENLNNSEYLELFEYAKEMFDDGEDTSDIVELLLESIKLNPHFAKSYALLGETYQHADRFEEAIENFHKAQELDKSLKNSLEENIKDCEYFLSLKV
jgi:5-methylcytosine-specific restriction endonuclease McrBC regulatory subunit McrC/ankyrin repeat protein